MTIHVLFFASLADITGLRDATVEAVEGQNVGSIFSRFARECPALEARRHSTLFAVNAEFARAETPVKDGDEIAFFPPVSGG